MKIVYLEPKRLHATNQTLLENIIAVVEEYQTKGYRMTLRQLYYQLVSKNVIPNQDSQYKKVGRMLTDARMSGLIDWDFIEDRIRIPKIPSEFPGIPDLINAAINSYRLERWADQENYVEVWVEKDALSGVLEPVTREYHVNLLVNRGYSSASALHDSSLRIFEQERLGKQCTILYFGDHDPSGEDMVRDIENRLRQFSVTPHEMKVALTMDQIEEYDLPPNPAKLTDPRSNEYVNQHGNDSWELDALPPNVLDQLLRDSLDEIIDKTKYKGIIKQEEIDKKQLVKLVRDWK